MRWEIGGLGKERRRKDKADEEPTIKHNTRTEKSVVGWRVEMTRVGSARSERSDRLKG